MSKKLEKLRASQAKDREKLETLQARLKAREEDIRVEEKTEILGIVEEIGMTPEQLANAARMIKPRVLFPYHYNDTPIERVVDLLADEDINIRIRPMK